MPVLCDCLDSLVTGMTAQSLVLLVSMFATDYKPGFKTQHQMSSSMSRCYRSILAVML